MLFRVLSPKSLVLGPQSLVRGPRSEVLGPQSEVLGPQSEILSPKSYALNPTSSIRLSGIRNEGTWDPGLMKTSQSFKSHRIYHNIVISKAFRKGNNACRSLPSDEGLLAQIPAPRFVLRPNRMGGMTVRPGGKEPASAACATDAARYSSTPETSVTSNTPDTLNPYLINTIVFACRKLPYSRV